MNSVPRGPAACVNASTSVGVASIDKSATSERILVVLARSSDVGSSDDVDDDLAGSRCGV